MTKQDIINKWLAKIAHCDKMETRMVNSEEYTKAHDFHNKSLAILRCLEDLKKLNEATESEEIVSKRKDLLMWKCCNNYICNCGKRRVQ